MSPHLFKLLPIAGAVALLAACGGGNDAPANDVAWASPAYIVPAGAASKSIALTECDANVQTATLVVTSAGDMIFSGAPDGTTTVSVLNRINYSSATYRFVQGTNGEGGPSAFVELDKEQGEDYDYMYAGTGGGGYFYSQKESSPSHSINCSLTSGTTSFALTSLPSAARVASLMTSGVTSISTTSGQPGTSATFAGGVATWDGIGSGTSPYRYVQFNVNTGALATGATATGTFTATTINIPTTPTSTYATFYEETDGDEKSFYARVEQTLGAYQVSFSRLANVLTLWWD